MSKSKNIQKPPSTTVTGVPTETGRGIIRDNFLAAIVTSRVYRCQVISAKKGKGSYQRKDKNKGRESYLMAA
ncbi:MAG: ribosome alternative rescue factor ArfA [Motiliproteus sp.]